MRLAAVHRFAATTDSDAVVHAGRQAIWSAITDPDVLPTLTPLLKHITADGDLWHWELSRVNVLGIVVDPTFTERMTFDEGRRIDYHHEPPPGETEWAGAEGWYALEDTHEGDPPDDLADAVRRPAPRPVRHSGSPVRDAQRHGGHRVQVREQSRTPPRRPSPLGARLP